MANPTTRLLGTLKRVNRRLVLLGLGALVLIYFAVKLVVPDAVSTVTVTRAELVQTVVATGRVRSLSRAQLGSAVSGTVKQVLVREGDRVAAGQLLLQLEDREARAHLTQARAALAQAEAGQAAQGEVQASVARATTRSAQAAFEKSERDYARAKRLVEAGARSVEELEAARQSLEAARSERDIAQAQLDAATGSGADVRAAAAAVDQARAALAMAEASLANTRITAPGPGQILTRTVEPGDAVQVGRVLLTEALDGPTQLVAVPDEKDVARVREGQPAVASADAYPGRSFPARVSFVAPAIDASQGTIEVRLEVDSAPPYLMPDMTVSIQIETARVPSALVLPVEAVQDAWGTHPWVLLLRGGRLVRQPVTVGVRGEAYLEVLQGLDDGATVALPPYAGLAAGDRARRAEGR